MTTGSGFKGKELKLFKKGVLLERALVTMVNAHSGQLDRGGVPYQLHPITVMQLLNTDDEELQCIALLHDVPEDSDVTFSQLEEEFTPRIVTAVRLLTKQRGQSYEEYCEGLKTNIDAMRVKKADLTHNSDIRRLKGVSQKDIDRAIRYHRLYLELQQEIMNHEAKYVGSK